MERKVSKHDGSIGELIEALSHLDDKEREAVETMIAGVLHMHDAKRWTQATSAPAAKAKEAKARKAVTQ